MEKISKNIIPEINLHRWWQDRNQSLSTTTITIGEIPRFASVTLERGWRENKRRVSCIPGGMIFEVVFEWSNKFKMFLWEIKGVPDRDECKFHSANYWHQLNGCIAPGRRPKYINADRYIDVTGSKNTLKDFHRALKGYTKAKLIITTENGIK